MNTQEINVVIHTVGRLSEEYSTARRSSVKARVDFEILLVSRMAEFRAESKGRGYDMSCLRLLEGDEEAQGLYRVWKEEESRYKGLERIIEANREKIMWGKKIMDNNLGGEKNGY